MFGIRVMIGEADGRRGVLELYTEKRPMAEDIYFMWQCSGNLDFQTTWCINVSQDTSNKANVLGA